MPISSSLNVMIVAMSLCWLTVMQDHRRKCSVMSFILSIASYHLIIIAFPYYETIYVMIHWYHIYYRILQLYNITDLVLASPETYFVNIQRKLIYLLLWTLIWFLQRFAFHCNMLCLYFWKNIQKIATLRRFLY